MDSVCYACMWGCGFGSHDNFSALVVNDWDLYQKLLDHMLSRHIKTTADLHPVMMTEAPVGWAGVGLEICSPWVGLYVLGRGGGAKICHPWFNPSC